MKKYRNYIIAILIIVTALITVCFIPISATKLIPTIEKQISESLGTDAHLEHLVLRVGPCLKAKAPIVHIMYEDGQKFAQLDSVKFYIPWSSVIGKKPVIKSLKAKKITVRVSSDDKYLPQLLSRLSEKNYTEIPNIKIKGYKISYFDKKYNDNYIITGNELILDKLLKYKNFKLSTKGYFEINDTQYVNYDVSLIPQFDMQESIPAKEINEFFNKIKIIDFHSDIIADLKLYKNSEEKLQASGFINVDNISVFDKIEKAPKSFVYITLWGDKASILSNIYTSQNKKVYIDGMINNSQKPIVDLRVKTDDIELDALYNKLKIFTNFSKLKNIKSITGKLVADFTLKGDLNKLKSNGYLKISNAEIKTSGLKFSKINSDIDFSNNKINITNAIGYINNAPIMLKGNIDKDINLELLMSKVELKYLIPEVYGVQKGIISLVANITGKFDNIIHKENLLIENFKAEKCEKILSVDMIKIDTNKNNTAYINNLNIKTTEAETIKIPSMHLQVEKEFINLPDTNIFMPNSKLTMKGKATNYNNKNLSFILAIDGFVNSSDLKFIKTNSTRYPLKVNFGGNRLSQTLHSQILFEKAEFLDEPAIVNTLLKTYKDKNSDNINLKIEDMSVSDYSGKMNDDLKLNLKGQKKIVANGYIENLLGEKVLKNLRINFPQTLNIKLFDTMAQLKGDLFVNGRLSNPEVVGQLFIQNLFNQPLQLTLSNATVDFNKNIASINAPLVKIADSSIGVNATVYTNFSKGIVAKNLNIKSKFINTDTILMYKDTALKEYPISIKEGKFYSEKVLADLYGSQIYMTAYTSDFDLNNYKLSMKNISSEIFNGKLAGSLDFDLKNETFDSKIMAREVSASPIFDIISERKDNISGTMDFDAYIKGNLSSKNSLNGNLKFIVHNGRMSTLGKLEHLLYAQNVIADNMLRTSLNGVTKAITLKDTGLFKYLKGDIEIKNGIADIKMLQSLGPLMSLHIKGQYNTENDYAKLIILGRISDEIMSGLGAFGDFSINKLMIMLTGEENKYNIQLSDIEKLPQLPVKNTKEFRSVINGVIDKPASVQTFNWISYSEKSLKQKDVPMTNVKVPSFVNELPY